MNFNFLIWCFAVAVTIHNLEEALWLPTWSQTAGRWHDPVEKKVFRFAVLVLTVLAYVIAWLAHRGGRESLGAYLVAGYALAMLLNVPCPHLIATVVLRRYAPGLATALLLNLPVTATLLRVALRDGYIAWERFVWFGPLIVLGVLGMIPILFIAGRRLFPHRGPDA